MTDSSWIRNPLTGLPPSSAAGIPTDSARRVAPGRDDAAGADLETVSREFESLLVGLMLKEMRATVPESGLFPESMAEDIFTDMLDQQLSQKMAQNGGVGLSRIVFEQLDRSQTKPSEQ